MTSNDRRLPRGFFRLETQPEEGARIADIVDAVIPGGKGFVQQLFRAKKDVLQAFTHLLQAQVRELEDIDTAIKDSEGADAPSARREPNLSPRMRTIKEMMQEASAKWREQAPRPGAPPAQEPPAQGAPPPPQPGGTSGPEKFKPT
ncbi:hypothetical protein LY474_32510 [Myxococcus stipitatus]|uniref:hypothetical protein n=1 Tax=Myxococcus stipitatus TaxID=83455 RepID=UPI001F2AE626|nr:hypothetical protein [Myxococcus stipitatus]MCE9672541.1 hypothetical protein [Myxococcus stipitatus]